MKILVVYYSRTGNTKKLAEAIIAKLACDSEELIDKQKRSGIIGYMKSGRQTMKDQTTELEPLKHEPGQYDLIVIGTPIWVYDVSVPVRTFIQQNRLRLKKVAFFCTQGGEGDQQAFGEMASLCQKVPIATLSVLAKEAKKGEFTEKVEKFAGQLAALK